MRYARKTYVTAERSRTEIEQTLKKYGASEFHTSWTETAAMIAFRLKGLFVRFDLPFPSKDKPQRVYDQEVRQRWRVLLLTVKAKLEAVECKISTLEKEFLAFIVLPNNESVMDWLAVNAMEQIKQGQMPKLLPPPRTDDPDIVDAEFDYPKEKRPRA